MTEPNGESRFTSNPALDQLASFVGEWNIEITAMSFREDPSAVVRGRSSFEWLEAGSFLLQRSEIADSDFPRSTAVMAPDDQAGTYAMLYSDSRGVSRIYRMTLSGTTWTLWREFPGFSQRFHGTLTEDGSMITARWEKSTDGANWELDFALTYTRVR